MRQYRFIDHCIDFIDQRMATLYGVPAHTRQSPARAVGHTAALTPDDRQHVIGLLRVDHAGEVAAQGLYWGQSLAARCPETRQAMQQAAHEENDHLAWCAQRLNQLGGRVSYLGPLWYIGSATIGLLAGRLGDRWSLGFIAETERQVVAHLNRHLAELPAADQQSAAVLLQMREDESAHAVMAVAAGGKPLPSCVKRGMQALSRVMTTLAYWC